MKKTTALMSLLGICSSLTASGGEKGNFWLKVNENLSVWTEVKVGKHFGGSQKFCNSVKGRLVDGAELEIIQHAVINHELEAEWIEGSKFIKKLKLEDLEIPSAKDFKGSAVSQLGKVDDTLGNAADQAEVLLQQAEFLKAMQSSFNDALSSPVFWLADETLSNRETLRENQKASALCVKDREPSEMGLESTVFGKAVEKAKDAVAPELMDISVSVARTTVSANDAVKDSKVLVSDTQKLAKSSQEAANEVSGLANSTGRFLGKVTDGDLSGALNAFGEVQSDFFAVRKEVREAVEDAKKARTSALKAKDSVALAANDGGKLANDLAAASNKIARFFDKQGGKKSKNK